MVEAAPNEGKRNLDSAGADTVKIDIGDHARGVAAGKNINQLSGVNVVEALLQAANIDVTGDLNFVLEQALDPTRADLDSPAAHRHEEMDFLARMEDYIREELAKSGDEHFVELSMQIADPQQSQGAEISRNFALLFGETNAEQPVIPDLVGLEETLVEKRSLILLGTPGSGKTTILHHFALRLIRSYREGKSVLLPLFIPLTSYLPREGPGGAWPVLSFLKSSVAHLVGSDHFISQNFEGLLKRRRFLIILDGLDQMPDRKSETIRLERLRQAETDLRRLDGMLKLARVFRLSWAVNYLVQSRTEISTQLVPQPDNRELEIESIPSLSASPVIASCRYHDFIGTPGWQQILVLPMDEGQVEQFVDSYAPEARDIVRRQWRRTGATRSLISNPFYLRMLTGAFEQARASGVEPEVFRHALARRGRLLEFLLRLAIARELGGESPIETDGVLSRLGRLAYYMLERNIIGAVPVEALKRELGANSELILDVAEGTNLITLRQGPPISIEFNHQLFLEFLLAYHLRSKSQTADGFEEGVSLLARSGDRWAETVKLLFEMVDDPVREELLSRFVAALRTPQTWDISTRVLADVEHGVGPRMVPLLHDEDELTRRGAIKVLGQIKAMEFLNELVAVKGDPSWRIRRTAVDALTNMRQLDSVNEFDNDRQPNVIRAVFLGKLQLHENPQEIIDNELNGSSQMRLKQMIWALHDLFVSVSKHISHDDLRRILREVILHIDVEVKALGYLMLSQAPESVKRGLKSELIDGALEEEDTTVNFFARSIVCNLLTARDIETIEAKLPDPKAQLLLLDAGERTNPRSTLDRLITIESSAESINLIKSLSERNDPVSSSMLVYLLGDERWAPAALQALVNKSDGSGIGILLATLDDPAVNVRLSAAQFLQHCYLPKRYGKEIRRVLRMGKIRSHQVVSIVNPLNEVWMETSPRPVVFLFGLVVAITMSLGFTLGYWLLALLLGLSLTFAFLFRFTIFSNMPSFPYNRIGASQWMINRVENYAYSGTQHKLSTEYWLARGRIARALGDLDVARAALTRALADQPSLAAARLELALIERSRENREGARAFLEADDQFYLAASPELQTLHRLMSLEAGIAAGVTLADRVEEVQLLCDLRLWEEVVPAALAILKEQEELGEIYYYLFKAYNGQGATRRAVAAAVRNRELGPTQPGASEIDVENLRWLHRGESIPVEVSGRFKLLMDLEAFAAARMLLQSEAILPSPESDLEDQHLDRVLAAHLDMQRQIVQMLRQSGEEEKAERLQSMILRPAGVSRIR